MKSTLQKLIFGIITFIIVPVVLFLLITSRSGMVMGIQSYDVLTGSMEPTIHVGSLVFTKHMGSYGKGDIITFRRGNITVTHRIVGMKGDSFITKGDHNKATDPQTVSRTDIVGRDFLIVPNLGVITRFVKTVPGFILLIGIPTLLLVIFEIRSIREELEKEIEKQLLRKLESRTA